MGKCEDRLRSGCELLRSGLAWMVEGYYLCSVDVGRAGPEKPNGKESKGRKVLWDYELRRFSLVLHPK